MKSTISHIFSLELNIILGIIFFLFIGPVAIIERVAKRKKQKKTFWVTWEQLTDSTKQ